MASQLIREAIRRDIEPAQLRTAKYTSAMDIFMEIKESYRTKEVSESAVMLAYRSPQLLVIDEITVRSDSAWENMLLTHLIDKRYCAKKDTILLGNCKDASEVVACVGASIASRIQECGCVVVCDWPSFRAL